MGFTIMTVKHHPNQQKAQNTEITNSEKMNYISLSCVKNLKYLTEECRTKKDTTGRKDTLKKIMTKNTVSDSSGTATSALRVHLEKYQEV